MRAVHFGAGNIGRGFLGQLYWESGWEVLFVDVAETVVEGLQQRGWYPLALVSDEGEQRFRIDRVNAVDARDLNAVAVAVAGADLLSTAVGTNVLPRIAPALAAGLRQRWEGSDAPRPLDIIICENLLHAGPFLRDKIAAQLPETFHPLLETHAGFVEASVGRMVPVMTEVQHAEDPLLVCVEPYCELPVDAEAFRGPIPEIAHLKPIPNFAAYVERKLYVHNMSHAATAYHGFPRGHTLISGAIRDPAVRELVEAALAESCAGLAARHGLDRGELDAHAQDLIRRYHNRALADQVTRVARDPVRKLSRNDRLIGAALMCLEQGITPTAIVTTIVAGLRYDDPEDPAAQGIQQQLREQGAGPVLERVCGLAPGEPLWALIMDQV